MIVDADFNHVDEHSRIIIDCAFMPADGKVMLIQDELIMVGIVEEVDEEKRLGFVPVSSLRYVR